MTSNTALAIEKWESLIRSPEFLSIPDQAREVYLRYPPYKFYIGMFPKVIRMYRGDGTSKNVILANEPKQRLPFRVLGITSNCKVQGFLPKYWKKLKSTMKPYSKMSYARKYLVISSPIQVLFLIDSQNIFRNKSIG
jgi:hypothetical protein